MCCMYMQCVYTHTNKSACTHLHVAFSFKHRVEMYAIYVHPYYFNGNFKPVLLPYVIWMKIGMDMEIGNLVFFSTQRSEPTRK